MQKLILSTLISLIFLSNIVVAQLTWPTDWPEGFASFVSIATGLPLDLFTTDKILYWVIIPFLAVWFAIYGVMSDIRLFRRKEWIHWALSFFMAFLLLPTGFFGKLILLLYGLGGAIASLAVGVVFLVGAIAWGRYRLGRYAGIARGELKDIQNSINTNKKRIIVIDGDIEKLDPNKNAEEINAFKREKKILEGNIERLQAKLSKLEAEVETEEREEV